MSKSREVRYTIYKQLKSGARPETCGDLQTVKTVKSIEEAKAFLQEVEGKDVYEYFCPFLFE